MNWKKIIIPLSALLLGFAAGFIFADTANKKEQDRLRAEVARLNTGRPAQAGQQAAPPADGEMELPDLTEDQLRNAVARADANPSDASLQRVAGQALHLYAVQKGHAAILPEAARILKRAHEADPKDVDILLRLANSLFILAQNGQTELWPEARAYLEKAAALRPTDADIRASVGLTYYHDKPSDPRRAAREYRKALEADPRNELALQGLATALISTGDSAEAEQKIVELERINSSNPALPNLRAQLAQKRNAAREQN